MIMADYLIDQVQGLKKAAVKVYITNGEMSDLMNSFIDTQTEYTKKAAHETEKFFSELTTTSIKTMQNATKFDYFKFGEGIMKAYQGYSATSKR
jgi:hypothetical protein